MNNKITNLILSVFKNLNIEDVCISPGARNTPLIQGFANFNFKTHFILDERSSGFYALGIAKKTKRPVVVCCTSGTALANLFPAIIEARMSENPLIILTADRPKASIGKGENQTIYQNNIYGKYVCHNTSIDLTDKKESIIDKINIAINSSLGSINEVRLSEKGPVHINVHIDEPLINSELPDKNIEDVFLKPIKPILTNNIFSIDKNVSKPIIICGQSDLKDKKNHIFEISNKINAPILADISSNVNGGSNVISFYDHFIDKLQAPDLILRFGSMPQSKKLISLIKNYNDRTYLFRSRKIFNDDVLKSNIYTFIDKKSYLQTNVDWLNLFKDKDALINKYIYNSFVDFDLNEYAFAYDFIEKIPENSNVFIGNSLIIRAFNIFSKKNKKRIKFFSNRGVSGIDGNLSTALGIASKSKKNNYLIIGDQSFMHDIGALQILVEKDINLSVFIINNFGGAIFDYLPISKQIESKIFKRFVRNEHKISFQSIVESYRLDYRKITSMDDLNNTKMDKKRVYELIIEGKNSLKFIRQFSTSLIK
tara:strand:- start:2502 stop:4118 length:1617 start_codon:yes stop_codon:yes gene_type:complete